jgi:MEDS: MEthanogen/methylotroph, DcmR Sensory domain
LKNLKNGDVTIESTSEWYFPGGKNPNPDRIIPTFAAMVDLAISKGKNAIRIFGNMSAFFKSGFTTDLLNYESLLHRLHAEG